MDEANIPGVSLAVIEDNRIVFSHAYGYGRLEKNRKLNKRTVFEGASLTKTYLAFVAHQLIDEGKLDLDKPLYQYLPHEDLEYDPRYKQITPRMILSHSSGLENWARYNDRKKLEIMADPGTEFIYSGAGYAWLNEVIEKMLGQPYEEFITKRILQPLKFKRTFLKYSENKPFPFFRQQPSNYAYGHTYFGEERQKRNNTVISSASGNHFIAEEYAKLILAIFDGKHLSPTAMQRFMDPVIRTEPDGNSRLFYGLGMEIIQNPTDTILSQGGSNRGFKSRGVLLSHHPPGICHYDQ